jgi:CTP-dependent riboflavin kinase
MFKDDFLKAVLIAAFFLFIFSPLKIFAVSPSDLIKLKKAGVNDPVIIKIIESDAITRAIISVDEIISMKAVEIPDEAILKLIDRGGPSAPELNQEDDSDRTIQREILRREMVLELQKKELDVLKKELDIARMHLIHLIDNPEIIKLVREGKISGMDFTEITKYLKQYARDEGTDDYGNNGDLNVDVTQTR